jgi:hypothetical protein
MMLSDWMRDSLRRDMSPARVACDGIHMLPLPAPTVLYPTALGSKTIGFLCKKAKQYTGKSSVLVHAEATAAERRSTAYKAYNVKCQQHSFKYITYNACKAQWCSSTNPVVQCTIQSAAAAAEKADPATSYSVADNTSRVLLPLKEVEVT